MNNAELFDRFEKDILYDCHSLCAKISRSWAARIIVLEGRRILKDLANHLKTYEPPTEVPDLNQELKHAWAILMSWICEEHSLSDRPEKQSDFTAWVDWARKLQMA